MQPWAKTFYLSRAWRRVRVYIIQRDCGLCVRCGDAGEIVHHRTHLTPENITNPAIALGEDNLETLCRVCHALEHSEDPPADPELTFDDSGNLIKKQVTIDSFS